MGCEKGNVRVIEEMCVVIGLSKTDSEHSSNHSTGFQEKRVEINAC